MTEPTKLKIGQLVRAFSNRWTPTGWEPVEEIATVLDPCVENDPDYAGDVEIKIEGVLGRTFVSRASVEPIDEPAANPSADGAAEVAEPGPEEVKLLRGALADLAFAEADYRQTHDLYGDGSKEAGRAWDLMRRAGDKARAAIGQSRP